MRTVVLYELLSLDGGAEEPGDWFADDGPEMFEIHGSISLAGSLLTAGLVDELRLVVAPTLAGRGRRLFDDDAPMHRLELGDVERSSAGSLFLTYRRRA
jgi:dihydrofolate reductase